MSEEREYPRVGDKYDFRNRLVISLETIADGLKDFVAVQTDGDLESMTADRDFLIRLNNGFQEEIKSFRIQLSNILDNTSLTFFDKVNELRKLEERLKAKVQELTGN